MTALTKNPDALVNALRSIPPGAHVGTEASMLVSCSSERLDNIERMLSSICSQSPTSSPVKSQSIKRQSSDMKDTKETVKKVVDKKVKLLQRLYGL
jgi:hypothetical protein